MSNDVTRAEWTGKAELWVRHERIYDAAFAAFTRAVIDAAELGPGLRVLDVGCGAG
ncbi:MAG: methyltransferase type 11, partial [Rhodococcus sp.]|nr:methyltransferase type 11 [Rhodococcus sp. (in: high G+C Gram-positive bacteria)]